MIWNHMALWKSLPEVCSHCNNLQLIAVVRVWAQQHLSKVPDLTQNYSHQSRRDAATHNVGKGPLNKKLA